MSGDQRGCPAAVLLVNPATSVACVKHRHHSSFLHQPSSSTAGSNSSFRVEDFLVRLSELNCLKNLQIALYTCGHMIQWVDPNARFK